MTREAYTPPQFDSSDWPRIPFVDIARVALRPRMVITEVESFQMLDTMEVKVAQSMVGAAAKRQGWSDEKAKMHHDRASATLRKAKVSDALIPAGDVLCHIADGTVSILPFGLKRFREYSGISSRVDFAATLYIAGRFLMKSSMSPAFEREIVYYYGLGGFRRRLAPSKSWREAENWLNRRWRANH